MHLVLGKDEIQDKSKADWLLKSLAVLQVVWIIINVIFRFTTGLAVSQIEIATVAFAIMAVLIYLANWWKPKDISQPTVLHFYGYGKRPGHLRDRKQSFTKRILSPSWTIDRAESGVSHNINRAANDVLWLEGEIPLLFYLMAGSSFGFGALHCLAWNFEFPTWVELICWRIASLASAILPVVALAISCILGHLVASKFSQHNINPKLSAALDLILPDEPRHLLMSPTFLHCSEEALYAFAKKPKESRKWENLIADTERTHLDWRIHNRLLRLAKTVSEICPSLTTLVGHSWENKVELARDGKNLLEEPEVLELWRDYEDFVMSKYHHSSRPPIAADAGPITTYLYQILDEVEKISTPVVTLQKWAERASNLVSITSFVLYTAARLVILVLCFTSLRAAPAGLYQDNVWTRFLPKVS